MKLTQFQVIREIGEIEGISLEAKQGGKVEVFMTIRGKQILLISHSNSGTVSTQITRIGITNELEKQL